MDPSRSPSIWISSNPVFRKHTAIFRFLQQKVAWCATCLATPPHMGRPLRLASLALLVAVLFAVASAACGGGGDGAGPSTRPVADAGKGADTGMLGMLGSQPTIQSLTVDPPTATIESLNGASVTQSFTVSAKYSNGTTSSVSQGLSWSATDIQAGAIDQTGLYTANGSVGGLVTITASVGGQSATAQLTVKLHIVENSGSVGGTIITALGGASTPDATVVWAYPYNKTVFPRGLIGPTLQWNGGAAADVYYVHVLSPTFELEMLLHGAAARAVQLRRLRLAEARRLHDRRHADERRALGRHAGHGDRPAHLDHRAAVDARHHLLLDEQPRSGDAHPARRGDARRLRLPGAAQRPHAVHAELLPHDLPRGLGRRLDDHQRRRHLRRQLQPPPNQPIHYLGGTWGNPNGTNSGSVIQWMSSALSPTGKYLLVNTQAVGLSNASGSPASPAGLRGPLRHVDGHARPEQRLRRPFPGDAAFSPEGSKVAFVAAGDPAGGTWTQGWNIPPPGDLQEVDFSATATPMATNLRTIVATGADPTMRIAWPTFSPDGNWVIYQRGASADTRYGNGDLYIASTTTPNVEMRLASLDGDGYPFAAGARDLSWNFEPAFAPVAAGGYFWVVLTSRRTYGNILTGAPNSDATTGFLGTKQLWVAAIDQNPVAGQDPSHPPFHLEGQAEDTINMRGFWALDPCKMDGVGCASGTECCGGYCSGSGDAGALVCASQTNMCAQAGDRCNLSTDCCNAAAGVTCINHVCSEPPPK